MKLSTWAKKQGIHYITAWKWFKKGTLPVLARQLPSGTILIEESARAVSPRCVIYCRVSNHSRKAELEYQIQRCESFCAGAGVVVDKIYKEIASGLNDNRREFWKAIDSKPTVLVVEHKDRLTRFGFNYLDKARKAQFAIQE